MRTLVLFATILLAASTPKKSGRTLPQIYDDPWYRAGRATAQALRGSGPTARARNVIIFIGDGLGVSTVTAARILEGQLRGETGEENLLAFEKLSYTALAKTYNTNAQVPDSAGTATAIMTGVKTRAGVISVDQDVMTLDHTTVSGNVPLTLFEIAEGWGMSTGVLTTSTITDATPATAYAHSASRDWQNDTRLTEAARAAGAVDIARQLVEFRYGDGIDVALGGGRNHFLPSSESDPENPATKGRRGDGRNLISEWSKRPASAYVWNRAQFEQIRPDATKHLLGLFDPDIMESGVDRASDPGGEPSVAEMTAKAIEILSRNTNGFVLLVEDEWIDEGHHKSNAYRALHSTIALSDAVKLARQKTNPAETLIIVTGDHSHLFAVGGRAARGNPILGKVIGLNTDGSRQTEFSKDANGMPYTSLLYGTGPGYRSPRPDLTSVDTTHPDYVQESAVPTRSEYHGAEDVPIYAGGAGAHLFHGVMEQNVIFHLILEALTAGGKAR